MISSSNVWIKQKCIALFSLQGQDESREKSHISLPSIPIALSVPSERKAQLIIETNLSTIKKLRKQLNSGRFRAMAEVLMYRAEKGRKAPEVTVYPGDQRVQAALDAAIANRWLFVVLIEFSSLGGHQRRRFMDDRENMLDTHPDHPFCLNVMGQLETPDVGRLIEKHKHIYFITSHANPVIFSRSRQPWVNLFKGQTLAPRWKKLVIQFSDRFIFALDNVWEQHWREFYLNQMDYWRKAMGNLPTDVAHAVAHRNAERLWKIPRREDR